MKRHTAAHANTTLANRAHTTLALSATLIITLTLTLTLALATAPKAHAQTLLRARESSPTKAATHTAPEAAQHRPDRVLVKLTPEARAQGTKTSNVFKNAIAYNKLFDTADDSAWVEVQIDTQSHAL